jgi:hypothetical protein
VFRAVLPLWRFWTVPLLMLGSLLPFLLTSLPFLLTSERLLLVISVVFLSVVLTASFERVIRRLFIYAVGCRTVRGKRLSVHCHSELFPEVERDGLLNAFEYDYEALTRWFGSRLRRRVAVYLMPRFQDVTWVYGKPVGGLALIRENAVIVPLDENCGRTFRHELAHLFAARLGPSTPAFKMEGLCAWVECDGGWPILDQVCLSCIDSGGLSQLLRRQFFRDPKNWYAGYRLAGSFTSFLIERFGWEKYGAFYKGATRWNFAQVFEKSFGRTLQQVESQWRIAALTRQSKPLIRPFDIELNGQAAQQ